MTISGLGPHGERASPPERVTLLPDDRAVAKEAGWRVAVVLHTLESDWAKQQIAGMVGIFGDCGAAVIDVVDCGFSPERQVAELDRLIALHPDAIISLPVANEQVAAAHAEVQRAREQQGGNEDENAQLRSAATALSKAELDLANGRILDEDRGPSRKVGGIDNRGSHFYLALYWAQALAAQTEDAALQAQFATLAKTLTENEATIVAELNAVQGKPVDIGGYYHADAELISKAMRPSATFNAAIAALV